MPEILVAVGRMAETFAELVRDAFRRYREHNAMWYDCMFGSGKKGSVLLHMKSGLLDEVRHPYLAEKVVLTIFPIGEVAAMGAATITLAVLSLPFVHIFFYEDMRDCVSAGVTVVLVQWAVFTYWYSHMRYRIRESAPSSYEREFVAGLTGEQAQGVTELPGSLPSWWSEHVSDIVFWHAARSVCRWTLLYSVASQTVAWLILVYFNADGGAS